MFPFFCIVICSMFLLNSIQTEDREYKDVVQSIKASVFFWDESLQKKQKIEGSSVSMRINQLDAMVDIISQTNIFVGYGRGFRKSLRPDLQRLMVSFWALKASSF